jgi:hypothetical protein
MKARWGREGIPPIILSLSTNRGEQSASYHGCFTPSTHEMGGWLGCRAGLDIFSFPCQASNPVPSCIPVSPMLTTHSYNNSNLSVPVHAMMAYGDVKVIAPLILSLGTGWMWGVSVTPWPLYSQGNPPGIHWIEALMGPRHSLDTSENHNSLIVHPMAQTCLAISEMHYSCFILCCLSVL